MHAGPVRVPRWQPRWGRGDVGCGDAEEGECLPCPLQRRGLGLAVADDGQGDVIGAVHHRPERAGCCESFIGT